MVSSPVELPIACLAMAAALMCAPACAARLRLAVIGGPVASVRRLRAGSAAPMLGGALAGLLVAGPGGALAGAVVAATVRGRRRRRRAAAQAATVTEQLAATLGRIADELRTGAHPATALAGIVADGPYAHALLASAAAAAELGDDIAVAIRRSAAAHPAVAADLTRLASAWSLADQHGIPLAELLSGTRDELRWRVRFGASVQAQLAGPRATATVLTGLPVIGIALGQLVGADPIGVLRGGPIGQVLVVLGTALAVGGSLWSDQIIRSAVPR